MLPSRGRWRWLYVDQSTPRVRRVRGRPAERALRLTVVFFLFSRSLAVPNLHCRKCGVMVSVLRVYEGVNSRRWPRLEMGARSRVKLLRQVTNEYAAPAPLYVHTYDYGHASYPVHSTSRMRPNFSVLRRHYCGCARVLSRMPYAPFSGVDAPQQILGVQAGMTRAIEYLSLDVTERLHRPCPVGQHPPVANRSPQQQIRRCVEGERGGERTRNAWELGLVCSAEGSKKRANGCTDALISARRQTMANHGYLLGSRECGLQSFLRFTVFAATCLTLLQLHCARGCI